MKVVNFAQEEVTVMGRNIYFYNANGIVTVFDCDGTLANVERNEKGYYYKKADFNFNDDEIKNELTAKYHKDGCTDTTITIRGIRAFVVPITDSFRKARTLNFKKNDVFIYEKEVYIPFEMCPVTYFGEEEVVPFNGYKKVTKHLYNFDCYVLAELKFSEHKNNIENTKYTERILRLNNAQIMAGCYVTMINSDERQQAENLAQAFNEVTQTEVFSYYNISKLLKLYNITEK